MEWGRGTSKHIIQSPPPPPPPPPPKKKSSIQQLCKSFQTSQSSKQCGYLNITYNNRHRISSNKILNKMILIIMRLMMIMMMMTVTTTRMMIIVVEVTIKMKIIYLKKKKNKDRMKTQRLDHKSFAVCFLASHL